MKNKTANATLGSPDAALRFSAGNAVSQNGILCQLADSIRRTATVNITDQV